MEYLRERIPSGKTTVHIEPTSGESLTIVKLIGIF